MRKTAVTITLIIMLSLLLADLINPAGSVIFGDLRDTDGSLSFSVRTATYNGAYAPRNAGVIWITNSQNQFIKTIKIWANSYRYTLIRWIASSGQNTTGAVTSASYNNHQLHNVTWNGKNYQNQDVPDGEYKINVEFTEHNANANNLGKFKQVTFVKGPDPIDINIPNESYFRDMHLVWQPVIQNGIISGYVRDESNQPIQGAIIQAGAFSTSSQSDGHYSLTVPPGTYTVVCLNTGYQDIIATDVVVTSNQTTTQDFIMMTVANDDPLSPTASLSLKAPYPNPFHQETTIRISLPKAVPYTIEIFNLRGQKLISRQMIPQSKGEQQLSWDGRDMFGKPCPPGIYQISINQGTQKICTRVTLR
ncbi:MAG TPA: DUF2271 domain-containing protein [Candidatus Cloacimonadota bacterium]|nr:DUF2271 domain-containing protein [Candidatus Cloacimonadota bacterium]